MAKTRESADRKRRKVKTTDAETNLDAARKWSNGSDKK